VAKPFNLAIYTADMGTHDDTWPITTQTTPHTYMRFDNSHRNLCPIPQASDRLVGRWFKCHPHELFPDADATIWIDACLQITSPTFASDLLHQSAHHGLAMFQHPDRTNVTDELHAADPMTKYAGNHHKQMVAELRETLCPDPLGLWAMTTIGRRRSAEVTMIDDLVWAETRRWSDSTVALDQLILPFVLAATHTPVASLQATWHSQPGGNLWHNDWFIRHPHRRDT
jgi:hypothetical protein